MVKEVLETLEYELHLRKAIKSKFCEPNCEQWLFATKPLYLEHLLKVVKTLNPSIDAITALPDFTIEYPICGGASSLVLSRITMSSQEYEFDCLAEIALIQRRRFTEFAMWNCDKGIYILVLPGRIGYTIDRSTEEKKIAYREVESILKERQHLVRSDIRRYLPTWWLVILILAYIALARKTAEQLPPPWWSIAALAAAALGILLAIRLMRRWITRDAVIPLYESDAPKSFIEEKWVPVMSLIIALAAFLLARAFLANLF